MNLRALALIVAVVVAPVAAWADDPVRLFTDKDDDAESAVVVRKIQAELALAAQGKGRSLVLAAVTTDEWGCECPPFVYAPFSSSAPDEGTAYFYPIVKSGLDPAAFPAGSGAGTYELTGRFIKDKANLDGWLDRRKVKHRAGGNAPDSMKAKQPVFAVERWCFRKRDEIADVWVGAIAQMKKAGVAFCK